MSRKPKPLKNRSLLPEEVRVSVTSAALPNVESVANEAAKEALQEWYITGYWRANARIPSMQVEANLKEIASIRGWQERKGVRNGYVMLTTLLDATLKPTILDLDYERHRSGGLTYRQFHQQVRKALELEPKVSLRMCSFRHWYRHMQSNCPVPEHRALPAHDAQCAHLLGTTVLYYTYVHLTD